MEYYIILLCKATIYMKPPNITYDANIVYIFVRSLFSSPKSIAICEATKMKQDKNIILNFVSIFLFHGTKVNEQINPTVTFFTILWLTF